MKVVVGGDELNLGTVEVKPTVGIIDFSRRVTDDFGVTTVVERGFARRMSVRLALPFDDVDSLHQRLTSLRATSAQWIADDRFAWLNFNGFYRSFEIDLNLPPLSFCTLTVDGLAEIEAPADDGSDPAPAGQTSSLSLIQPITITDEVLTSSSVAEDASPEWSAITTYAEGARVRKTATHRIYESAAAGNLGHDPAGESGLWIDVGPTNRWAMFDEALGSVTTASGSIIATLTGTGINSLALLDVTAATVRVQKTGYNVLLPVVGGKVIFRNIPVSASAITVTIQGPGDVKVGTLLAGRLVPLGVTESSPSAGITDFSRKEVDEFGEVTLVERAWAKRMATRALIATSALDMVCNRLAAVRGKPSLWIADDSLSSLTIYGFYRDFSIEVDENVSILSLSVEGLSKAAETSFPGSAVALSGYLTNESHTLPAGSAGNVLSYTGASGMFEVPPALAAATVFSVVSNPQGLTYGGDAGAVVNATTGAYQVDGGFDVGDDVATLTLRATHTPSGSTVDKVFSLAKSKAGTDGDDGTGISPPLVSVNASGRAFQYDGNGDLVAQTITFTAQRQNGGGGPVTWGIRDATGTLLLAGNADVIGASAYFTKISDDVISISSAEFAAFTAFGGIAARDSFSVEATYHGIVDRVTINTLRDAASAAFEDGMNYGSAEAFIRRWNATGPGTGDISIVPSDNRGGFSVKLGNNSGDDNTHAHGPQWIDYSPEDLYEVWFDLEFVTTPAAGSFYAGLSGVDRAGNNLGGTFLYIAAMGDTPTVGRRTYRGYARGHAGGFTSPSPATDPANPAPLPSGAAPFSFGQGPVVRIRPTLIVNYISAPGEVIFHGSGLRKIDDATVNWTGAWSNSRTYFRNDGVSYQGRSFAAKVKHTNQAPPTSATSNTYWFLVADKGIDGNPGSPGAPGEDGADGLSVAELNVYQRAASAPSTPTGGSYNFTTKVLTPPAGWSATVPTGTNPLYAARGTAFVTGTTGTATPGWLGVGKMAENGFDGAGVEIIFRRSATQPATPSPSLLPSGWYATVGAVPAGSDPIWMSFGQRPNSSANYTWNVPVKGTPPYLWDDVAGANKPENAADVTSSIEGQVEAIVLCDWQGNAKSGQLPKVVPYKLWRDGVDVSASATWTVHSATGTWTVSSFTGGSLTVSAISTDVLAVLKAVYGGKTRMIEVKFKRQLDAPPGGTTALASISGTPSSTAWEAISGELVVQIGAGGAANLQAIYQLSSLAPGTVNGRTRWYKWIGSAFSPIGAEELTPDFTNGQPFPSSGNHTTVDTGNSPGSVQRYRFYARSNGSYTTVLVGNAYANGG